jgi:hypothetical protein
MCSHSYKELKLLSHRIWFGERERMVNEYKNVCYRFQDYYKREFWMLLTQRNNVWGDGYANYPNLHTCMKISHCIL